MREITLEDKALITARLCGLLKLTRECSDLESLTYEKNPETLEESVHAVWKKEDGMDYHNMIDVTADSGIALIRDVCRAI